MSCLPKPVLRGHIQRRGLKSIVGAIALGAMNSTLFYFLVSKKKVEAYENFLRTYDPDAHCEELIQYGYYNSIKSKN